VPGKIKGLTGGSRLHELAQPATVDDVGEAVPQHDRHVVIVIDRHRPEDVAFM